MNKLLQKNSFLLTALIVAYLIILSTYNFLGYLYHKNEVMERIDKELYNIAATLKYVLPEDLHDRATDQNAISIKEDREIVQKIP